VFIPFFTPLPGRWRASGVALLLLAATSACAQNDRPPSLAAALEAAWSLSSGARALPNRQAEFDARQRAADSLLSSPAGLTLAHRSDRPASNLGLREYEAELGLPLWNPGVRSATAAQVTAERSVFETQQRIARLALAGQVRELAASATLAALERDLALRKQVETLALALDVQKRVSAGESARLDGLLADAAVRQASAVLAHSDSALVQLRGQWRALTGLSQFAQTAEAARPALDEGHPREDAARAKVRAAETRLALTKADSRDPLELGLGVSRERAGLGEPTQNTVRLSVRIPFGGDNRNAPRLAAARAELDEALADADGVARQINADVEGARASLDAAQKALVLTSERAALSGEAHLLIARSFQLGESDLPTRLRAESERFDTELALARARAELQRATSRLNQAQGLLP
jgi:outer membrane protein, heavy metal efflux system